MKNSKTVSYLFMCFALWTVLSSFIFQDKALNKTALVTQFENAINTKDYELYTASKLDLMRMVEHHLEVSEDLWSKALEAARFYRDTTFTQFIFQNQLTEHSNQCTKECKHQHPHNHN